jgi:hypothetical protein
MNHICIVFVSYLHRICIVFVSFLCRIFIVFASYLYRICIVFASYLYRICIVFVSYLQVHLSETISRSSPSTRHPSIPGTQSDQAAQRLDPGGKRGNDCDQQARVQIEADKLRHDFIELSEPFGYILNSRDMHRLGHNGIVGK